MLFDLIRHGRRPGITWCVVFLEDGPMVAEMRELGVSVDVVPAGRLRNPVAWARAMLGLLRVLRRTQAQIVLSWMTKAHLYGSPAAAMRGVSSVYYQLGTPQRTDPIDRLASLLPGDGVLVVSRWCAHVQAGISRRRPVRVVHPGADLARFDPLRLPPTSEARDQLGIRHDGPIVGIVGRLQHWKGAHVLIDATSRLVKRWPDLMTVIVGGSHATEPKYEHELRARADRFGINDHVVLAGLTTQTPLWMQAMDVVVHASRDEPFGIVVLEAMALAKPVVAGAEGGPSEIIEDGATGRLVRFGDAAGLAEAIDAYLRDPPTAARMGEAARCRALEFSSDRFASEVIDRVGELTRRGR